MKTYHVEQFEVIARPDFNRVLLPKVAPDFDLKHARVYVMPNGTLSIQNQECELRFDNISEKSIQFIRDAGGVSVMNPKCTEHPKLAHIPLQH